MNALNHISSPLDKYDNITDLLYLEGLIESQKVIQTVERCFEQDQKRGEYRASVTPPQKVRQLNNIHRHPPRLIA